MVSEITEIQKIQWRLYQRLQKEFKIKIRMTKEYLDDMGKEYLKIW